MGDKKTLASADTDAREIQSDFRLTSKLRGVSELKLSNLLAAKVER
jgi:hypothetical protein